MLKFKESNLSNAFLPEIFNINISSDFQRVQNLINEQSDLLVLDQIDSQLRELIKIRNPQKILKEEDYVQQIETLLNGASSQHYGSWVYYPWNKKLVHLLNRDEFKIVFLFFLDTIRRACHEDTYSQSPQESSS